NNQISLDFAATDFDYLETDDAGDPLDAERGWVVPGLSAKGSVMGKVLGISNIYASGRFTWVDGETDYKGSLIGGAYGSFLNTDRAEVWEGDFRLGKGVELGPSVMFTPFAAGGVRKWGRNLSGPSGYHEDYTHGYVGGGLLLQASPFDRLVLSVDGL